MNPWVKSHNELEQKMYLMLKNKACMYVHTFAATVYK